MNKPKSGENRENVIKQNSVAEKVCDLSYLTQTMNGKKPLIKEIIGDFLKQVPADLEILKTAILQNEYPAIKNVSHKMRSSVSLMGLAVLEPILKEMEGLGIASKDIEKIQQLFEQLDAICRQAFDELETEKLNLG